jgi:hypothetical protein
LSLFSEKIKKSKIFFHINVIQERERERERERENKYVYLFM